MKNFDATESLINSILNGQQEYIKDGFLVFDSVSITKKWIKLFNGGVELCSLSVENGEANLDRGDAVSFFISEGKMKIKVCSC